MEFNKQADEAAELAEQLHSQIFTPQTEPVEDTSGGNEEEVEQVAETQAEIDYKAELEKAEQRYRTLDGMFKKEKTEWKSELDNFKQTVFEQLEAARKPVVEEPKEDKFAKFREEYGEDLYEAIRELTKAETQELIGQQIKPVQDQVASVEDVQIKVAQDNFKSYLDSKVEGDWNKLWNGDDPKFVEFLGKTDPSGLYTYADLVKVYNDNWDADKLATVFNLYLKEGQPAPEVHKQNAPQKDALIAPSRTTQHTTPSSNDKRIWTQDAMAEFQTKDRQGKYSKEESDAMWNDLLAASSEGRIR